MGNLKKTFKKIISVVTLLLLIIYGWGQSTIENTNAEDYWLVSKCGSSSYRKIASPFTTPSGRIKISKIEVNSHDNNSNFIAYVRINTSSSGSPSNTIVSNGTSNSVACSPAGWIAMTYNVGSQPILSANTTYFVVLSGTSGSTSSSSQFKTNNDLGDISKWSTTTNCGSEVWGNCSPNGDLLYKIYYDFIDPYNTQLLSSGSSSQLAFNNSYINDNTPTFRASASYSSTFDRFEIEINTNSTFSGGTSYTQTFSDTYTSGTEYDLDCNSLSTSLPTTDGVTYYVRVRASADGGTNWGAWSTETYSFTYKTSGDVEWYQTTAAQLGTNTLNNTAVNAGNYIEIDLDTDNYGYHPSSVPSNTFGNGGYTFVRAVITQATTITSLNVFFNNIGTNPANPKFRMAIYSNDDNKPKNLIAETSETSVVTGWNYVELSTYTTIQAGTYWIGVNYQSNSSTNGDNNSRLRHVSGSTTSVFANAQTLFTPTANSPVTYEAFPSDASSLTLTGYTQPYVLSFTGFNNDVSAISPPINYSSFVGASSWKEVNFNTSGTGTVTVGVYSNAACTNEIIAPTATSPIDLSNINTTTNPTLYLKATLSGTSPQLDSWKISCSFGEPLITVSSLTAFDNQCINTTSSVKSYTVEGSNLADDITITPPSGYEISTSNSPFSAENPLILSQSGGTVGSTTIYVRFKPTAVQSYSGNITHESDDATTKNVAVSGNGVNTKPSLTAGTAGSITASSSTISGNTISDIGCSSVIAYGIEYSTTDGFTTGTGTQQAGSGFSGNNGGTFSVDLSSLSANTIYYYRAYATNDGGTEYSGQSSFTTLCQAPSTQTSNITFSSITATGMTINWTRGGTPGNGVIVVVKAGSTVDANPVNGTSYTANTAFGSGTQIGTGNYVVYLASGTSVAITGLTTNTTYHVKVYEKNCSGAGTVFNLTSPAEASQATACIAPSTSPSSVNFTSVTSNSMTVNWTRGGTPGDGVIVVAKAGSAPSDPSNNVDYTANTAFGSGTEIGTGSFVVFNGSGTSVNVTNLNPNTAYYFEVFEKNCDDTRFMVRTTSPAAGNRTTLCEPASIPFFEGFESYSSGINLTSANSCYSTQIVTQNFSAVWQTDNTNTKNGNRSIRLYHNNSQWFFIPVTLSANVSYNLSLWGIRTSSSAGTIQVGFGTTASSAGMTGSIIPSTSLSLTYTNYSGNFTPTTSDTYYIGVYGAIPNSNGYFYIDDINISINADENSIAESPSSQVGATTISSVDNVSDVTAKNVFSFKITDQGSTDNLATKVTNIRVKPGSNNNADWTDHIQGIKLYNETNSTWVSIGSPTITDAYIDIPISSGNLDIADGTSKELSLYIYLNTTNIVDNRVIQFRIDYDDHGFTAHSSGSHLASEFGSSDIVGNNITVEVVATEMQFIAGQPGSGVPLNSNFSVGVKATDIYGNTDLTLNSGTVTISKETGSGNLTSATSLTKNIINGIAAWSDAQYDATETCPSGFSIRASHSGSFSYIATGCIVVATAPSSFAITSTNGVSCAGGTISVSWNASSGADTYDLYWCNTSSCNPTSGANIITGVSSPYSFSIPNDNSIYNIKILANNIAASVWSSNMLTHSTNSASTWHGASNSNWSNTENWCGGTVPDCEDDIIILAGASNYPVLSAHASIKNLTIETGASLGLGSYTLSVYGDVDLGETTINAGTGTIVLANTGCSSASGTHYVDFRNNTIHHLTINSGSVYLVNNDLKLSGNLTINNGTLNANGQNIEIAGNWSNYALFVPGSGSVIFNGSGNSTIIKDGPEVVIYQTGFENSESGTAGWNLGSVPGKTEWRRQSDAVSGQRLSPASGTYDLSLYSLLNDKPGYAYDGTTNNNSYVDAQKRIDLTDVNSAELSFNWYCHGTNRDQFTGVVLANGVELVDNLYSSSVPASWSSSTINLDSYCNSETVLTFRMFLIKYSSSSFPTSPGNFGFAIDNIVIRGTESAESFNNLIVDKTGAGKLSLDDVTASKVNILNDFTINSGEFDAKDNRIRLYGDFTNNGIFTAGTSELIIKGDENQTISGTSDIEFYDVTLNSFGNLIIGNPLVSNFKMEITNSFNWLDNNDKITVGNGTQASLILPGDLTIYNGCEIETSHGSTISLAGHYVNYGTYTHHDGEIKFHGDNYSFIIKEPSEVIYYEGFETDNGGFSLGNSTSAWARSTGSAHNSNYDIAIMARDQNVPYDYLYNSAANVSATKVIDLTGYEVAELQFWWRCAGESGKDYGQLIINGDVIINNMHGKTMYTISPRIDISQYANAPMTLEFKWINDGSGGNSPGFCIDDIFITGTSINQETFYNLSVDKTNSESAILRCPIDVNNNVTISNGDLNSSGIDFPVGGNWYNYNSSTYTHNRNTITFDGNGEDKDQIIYNNTLNKFFNVVIDNAENDISLNNNRLYIENDLNINAGNLDANTQDIMIEGDWFNQGGTFDAKNKTVYFRGANDQQLICDGDAFYNLSLPNANVPNSGDRTKTNRVIMNDNVLINNNLILSAGALDNSNTYDVEIKGNWYNDGGFFIHPNNATTLVKFSGNSTQTVNLKADGATVNSSNFSFDNVEIDGTDVRFHIDTQNFLLLVRNLVINNGKIFKIIEE